MVKAEQVEKTEQVVSYITTCIPSITITGNQAIYLAWLGRAWRNEIRAALSCSSAAFRASVDALLVDIATQASDKDVFPGRLSDDILPLR